jgi:hypothetical protein
MSVYVDDQRNAFGRMQMCHMIADNTYELLKMVDAIGIDRKWIQKPGTYKEHFDICISKRKLAVLAGAVELTANELGRKLIAKRKELEK